MLVWWKDKIQGGHVCDDLIEFSDFLPTFAESGRATMPADRPIDGGSFLARLTDEPYKPRDSIFLHYDRDPDKATPEYRQVRSFFDGLFKLYLDGQMFGVLNDVEEEHPIAPSEAESNGLAVRKKLQTTLDAMWLVLEVFWPPKERHQTLL